VLKEWSGVWCLTGTAIIPWTVRLVIQIDFVGKVCVIQFDFSFLSQTIFSYRLECLLDINGLFSTSLKVWYIVFALTPALSSFSGDLNQTIGHIKYSELIETEWLTNCINTYGSIFQIHFISDDHKRKIFGISGRGLNQKFISPGIEWFEGIGSGHVKH
jgi:hypothetical protein